MKKTQNHQLCLWDPEDRIRREDFNADNAELDAALAGQTAALAGKLGRTEYILPPVEQEILGLRNLYFPQHDWNQWDRAELLVDCTPEACVEGDGIEIGVDRGLPIFSIKVIQPAVLVFLPMRDASRPLQGYALTDKVNPFFLDIPFSRFNNLRLLALGSNNIPGPFRFQFYGMR